MRSWRAAFVLTALLGVSGAPGAAQDYVPERVKQAVTQDDLAAITGSLGHKVVNQGEPGDVYVVGETEQGVRYFLFGTACETNGVPGCQGVMMQTRYELPPATTAETLARANLEQATLSTWADVANQTLGFTRYLVLDYGVTMANIRENVLVMLSNVPSAYAIAAGEE